MPEVPRTGMKKGRCSEWEIKDKADLWIALTYRTDLPLLSKKKGHPVTKWVSQAKGYMSQGHGPSHRGKDPVAIRKGLEGCDAFAEVLVKLKLELRKALINWYRRVREGRFVHRKTRVMANAQCSNFTQGRRV